MKITCKFGGTSLACRENVRRCCDIVKADSARRFVVVSAPGKRSKNEKKVTDLLLECYKNRFQEDKFQDVFSNIRVVFEEIAQLSKDFPIEEELNLLSRQIQN